MVRQKGLPNLSCYSLAHGHRLFRSLPLGRPAAARWRFHDIYITLPTTECGTRDREVTRRWSSRRHRDL